MRFVFAALLGTVASMEMNTQSMLSVELPPNFDEQIQEGLAEIKYDLYKIQNSAEFVRVLNATKKYVKKSVKAI